MIPKILHYVWVGGNEKTPLVLKCIESWKKYCPDYEIIEWNDESLAEFDNQYVKEAMKMKKYAFASDFIRLYALKKYGGVYLDSDVEITANIDEFLKLDFFSGFENYENNILPMTALMGAKKDNEIISDLLKDYDNRSFILPNGKKDMTPNTITISNYFADKFKINTNYDGTKVLELTPNSIIYPYWYFCTPKDGEINYSIHHFNGSWLKKKKKKNGIIYKEKIGSKRIIHIGPFKFSYTKRKK